MTHRALFTRMFQAAVDAADPAHALGRFLPPVPRGRTVVIGAGKAAAAMAQALEQAWPGPLEGVVVTRYGAARPCQRIEVIEASHPVPDAAGLAAASRLMSAVAGLTEDDLVIALISGGGSALLPSPLPGLTLADEIAVNQALLASGAPISAMNVLRKHLSGIKGGRLALAAWPARVVSLLISDIPGDAPDLIASGPTVPGPGDRTAAQAVVRDFNLRLPQAVLRHLETADAPDPGDPRFAGNEVHVIASAALSLEAAAEVARAEGQSVAILSDSIEGEARDVAGVHAAIAREIVTRGRPFPRPVLLLSGGETAVTLRAKGGKGGRNSEFLLALALGIEGLPGVSAFAADTDGIDGSEDNAGAFADAGSAARMRAAGADPSAALARNDAWTAFAATGDLFVTGPTGTNVNDLRIIAID